MKAIGESLRPIKISGHPHLADKSGFFHQWCIEPLYAEELTYGKTMALIELIDGRVKLVEPQYLQFTEPYMKQKKE